MAESENHVEPVDQENRPAHITKFSFNDMPFKGEVYEDINVSSPKSPSSEFTQSSIEDAKGCLIKAVLLSQWDNILGPKIRHLWTNSSLDCVPRDVLLYIACHTLSGEICRDPFATTVDTKFYVLKDKGIAVTAFVFGAMGQCDIAVHSLALIVPYAELKCFLNLYDICVTWIKRLISKLRILLEKGPTSVARDKFSMYLQDLVKMLKSLREAGVPQKIQLSETILHPQHTVEEGFLRKAIMSHIITCGHTVVVGKSASRINLMISTLSLFVSPSERTCCCYVDENNPLPYHPDLFVQGLFKETDGQIHSSIKDVLLSKYPTTLVDLNSEEVRHSSCSLHQQRHVAMLNDELTYLWRGQREQLSYPSTHLFHSFEDKETFVETFLKEIQLLPSLCGVREAYVDQFIRLLERKALAFVQYVEKETHCGKTSLRPHVKRIRQDLGLYMPGDFKMVVATAQKLRPGFYNYVFGDGRADGEKS